MTPSHSFLQCNQTEGGAKSSLRQSIPLRRGVARFLARCPLIPLTGGVILGQIALYSWCAGAFLVAVLALVSILFFIAGAVLRKRPSRSGRDIWAGALLGMCAAVVAQPALLASPPADPAPMSERWVTLSIIDRPVRPAPGLVRFDARIIAEHTRTQNGERLSSARGERWECRAVDLPWRQLAGLRSGDILVVRAAATPIKGTEGLFSYSAQLGRRGVTRRCRVKVATRIHTPHPGVLEHIRDQLRDSVHRQLGNGERAGLLLSLVIGERHALSTHTEQAFKRTGLSHVLVLSGYQVALFFGVVWWLMNLVVTISSRIIEGFRLPTTYSPRTGQLWVAQPSLLALGLTAFGLLVIGFESSSARAIIALGLVVVARLNERHTDMGNVLVLALLVLSLVAPGCALEPSTQLTFAALTGILVAHHLRVPGEGVLRAYARTSFWATLLPLLVAAIWFETFPLAGLICNPLMAPPIALWGTLGGACAMLLFASGIDPNGIMLRVIADGLVFMRELMVAIASELPRWAYEPEPGLMSTFLLGGLLIALCGLNQLGRRTLQGWNLSGPIGLQQPA